MPADQRLIIVFIPENSFDNAGLDAGAAARASFGLQDYAPSLSGQKGIFRTGARAWRVHAGPAGGLHETMLHASGRFDANAGLCKTHILVNTRTCEHAALAAYTFIRVQNFESHTISPVIILVLLKE